MLGYCHTTISLIYMSAHKASAPRCHLDHQAASGQPAIRALATAPLRRLTLNMLFTIATTSYQTTCTVSERSSIKGKHQCKPTWSSFSHYNTINTIYVDTRQGSLMHSMLSMLTLSIQFSHLITLYTVLCKSHKHQC